MTLLDSASRTTLQLHAAAVTFNGSGILLPAPSLSGKSTLTAGLLREGFDFLSDELITIEPATRTASSGRSTLQLRVDVADLFPTVPGFAGSDAGQQVSVLPGEVFGCSLPATCIIDHVVFPRYKKDESSRLTSMTRANALVELCRNTVSFNEIGPPALDLLALLVRTVPCVGLCFGDLREAVRIVADLAQSGGSRNDWLRRDGSPA